MAIALASKPGITGANTLAIPKDWDPTWFRNFINNQLKGADVRNAVGTNGIKVSGNISSPYATITIGVGPIVIPAGAPGTTTLTVISTGAGGVPLDIQRTGDGTSIQFERSGVLSAQLGFGNAFAAGQLEFFSIGTVPMGLGTLGATSLNFYTNSVKRLAIDSVGVLIVNLATSGVGSFGIGTTPDSALHVLSASSLAGFRVGYNGTSVNYYDADTHHFRIGASTTAILDLITTGASIAGTLNVGGTLGVTGIATFSGRVGIGTAPDSAFHVLAPGGIASLRVGYNGTSVNYYDADTHNFRTGAGVAIATFTSTGITVGGAAVDTSLRAIKTVATPRPSTTVLANDPDLVVAIPGAGTYAVEVLVSHYNLTSSAIGISCNLNYSGTFTANSSVLTVLSSTNPSNVSALITGTATTSLVAGSTGSGVGGAQTLIEATLVATGAGTLGFAWAQNASNAAATNVGAGSRMIVRKIA